MEHFIDIYKKKPELCEKLLDNEHIKVNLKVDGKPFQVLFNEETGELEFHGRSGDETHVGPIIDDYNRLFSKPINDAIKHIEKRVDVFKEYKFLTFEVIDKMLLLTAVVDKDNQFIESAAEIRKIADKLETDVMPTLWEGAFSQEQKDAVVQILSTGIVPEKDALIEWVKSMFGTYENYPAKLISAADDFIEGIVFFFPIGEKVAEYKIVDPTYRQSMKDRDAALEKEREEHAEFYETIYTTMCDWLEAHQVKLGDTKLASMEANFINMMGDTKVYNKLMNAGTKIKMNTSKTYAIQPERTSKDMQIALRQHGAVYKQLYELYIKTFYKGKKRGFIISPEFQERVNKIVDKF